MPFQDIRAFLHCLESKGELVRIKEELSPRFEVSAVFRLLAERNNSAAIVENVSRLAV